MPFNNNGSGPTTFGTYNDIAGNQDNSKTYAAPTPPIMPFNNNSSAFGTVNQRLDDYPLTPPYNLKNIQGDILYVSLSP